jgi:hypothetical protein
MPREWKRPATIAEKWENLTTNLKGDPSTKVKRDKRGRKIDAALTEQDKYEQKLYKETLRRKEEEEELKRQYLSGEITDYDLRREGITIPGINDGTTQNEIATEDPKEKEEKTTEKSVGTQLGEAFTSDIDEEGNTRLAIFDQTVATERAKIMNANAAVKKVDAYTNHSYTTNFKEAFRNANVSQVYEDTMGTDSPLVKSNVFTIDPATGLPLGVMGRSQRRAWDEANAKRLAQAEMDKNPEYQDPTDGSDTPKEWTTDDPVEEKTIGTQLGEGLKNIGDASNPKISFKPADKDEDD